jgi:hypothetical protein
VTVEETAPSPKRGRAHICSLAASISLSSASFWAGSSSRNATVAVASQVAASSTMSHAGTTHLQPSPPQADILPSPSASRRPSIIFTWMISRHSFPWCRTQIRCRRRRRRPTTRPLRLDEFVSLVHPSQPNLFVFVRRNMEFVFIVVSLGRCCHSSVSNLSGNQNAPIVRRTRAASLQRFPYGRRLFALRLFDIVDIGSTCFF